MRRLMLITVMSMMGAIGTSAAEGTSSANQPAPATDVQGGGTLSDKLSDTNGVIHPQQNADPGISKTPSTTGTMPVIPPPGSPGGDPSVKPK